MPAADFSLKSENTMLTTSGECVRHAAATSVMMPSDLPAPVVPMNSECMFMPCWEPS